MQKKFVTEAYEANKKLGLVVNRKRKQDAEDVSGSRKQDADDVSSSGSSISSDDEDGTSTEDGDASEIEITEANLEGVGAMDRYVYQANRVLQQVSDLGLVDLDL